MDSWIDDVRDVGVLTVAEPLGLTVRRRRFVCPVCGATRTPRDSAPPCGVTGDGLGWRCHACDAAGSTLDLVAEATCGGRPATGDRDAWARLRAECAALGLCDPAPGSPPPRRPPPPRPVAPAPPDPAPPPPAEVADLWGRCRGLDAVDADGPVAAWLDGRELPREDLAAEDLTRELPAGEECPSWATAGRPWSASPRLLLPLFGAGGELVALWARWAGRGEVPKVKERAPTGCARVGLLADRRGRELLAGDVPEDLAGVLVVEGSTDWLRAAVAVARGDAPPLAVLGGVSGSWKYLPEALSALPPDVPVYAAQDPGNVGDRYAEETRAALPGWPVYRVELPAEEDLDDRLRSEPGALADDDDGWGLLRVARENGPMADDTTTTDDTAEAPADPWQDVYRPVGDWGWFDSEPPKHRWLLRRDDDGKPRGVLPRGVLGVLGAAGGAGKTWALTELALLVATGGTAEHGCRWLGSFDVAGGPVLFLAAEETADELHRRLCRVRERWPDITAAHLARAADHLVVVPAAGRPELALMETNDKQGLAESRAGRRLRNHLDEPPNGDGWALIVVDPLARWTAGEVESSNAAATRAVQILERLAAVPGRPTVLTAHHTSQAHRTGKVTDGTSGIRGVTGLTDAARWVALLESRPDMREHGYKGPPLATLTITKNNYAAPCLPVALQRVDGVLQEETKANRDAYATAEKAKAKAEREAKARGGDGAGGKARRGDDAAGGVRRSGQAGDRLDV